MGFSLHSQQGEYTTESLHTEDLHDRGGIFNFVLLIVENFQKLQIYLV